MKSNWVDTSITSNIISKPKPIPRKTAISQAANWRLLTFGLILTDLITISAAFWASYAIRFTLNLAVFQHDVLLSKAYYATLILTLTPIWVVIFAGFGLYKRENLLGGTREYAMVFNAVSFGILLLVFVGFFQLGFVYSRGWVALVWALGLILAIIGRFTVRRVVYGFRRRGYFLSPTLVIGANREGSLLAEQLLTSPTSGLHLVGFVDDEVIPGAQVSSSLFSLGRLDDLQSVVNQHGIEELILTSSALSQEQVIAIFKQYGLSDRVNLRMSSGLYEIITTGLEIKESGFIPLVSVNKVRLTGFDQILKTVTDYGVATLGVILLAPIFLIVAIAVKLDSPGPVIYRRRVMGVNGSQFDAYKFRTMLVNGDEILAKSPELQAELSSNYKLKQDPRITRVGKFLRKFSLDEFPQLFNVLKNEMSLVGPRMICPEELEKYSQWGINLLTVKPGITGLWQVSGRSDISYEERVKLDMHYIRNWTIWLDLYLVWRTIPAVLNRRGAY